MRLGKNDAMHRVPTETENHDYDPKTTLTPYGIFLPNLDELFLYFLKAESYAGEEQREKLYCIIAGSAVLECI